MDTDSPWLRPNWVSHTRVMLDSYRRWTGRDLVERTGSADADAERLFHAPFVVVAHNTAPDPLLTYANRVALDLWGFDVPTLLHTPSRLTAEPQHRDERARLMERVARDGFADDYAGVRVTAGGRRFRIAGATVWNLVDTDGRLVGQAATFADWRFLDDAAS